MIELPNITLCCIDTVAPGEAVTAIQKSLKHIKPARVILFTDIDLYIDGIEVIKIDHIYSKKQYSEWMMKEFGKQDIQTSHVLVIQADGYVLDGDMWTDEFLEYSYGGAVWPETDGYSVGNGGFSLRSWHLQKVMAEDDFIIGINPEDVGVARIYRDYLEKKHGIKFMPEKLAHQFSYELFEPMDRTFGFHGKFHPPYAEPIVIKRTAALGDVISVEPVLEYFYKKGHPVYLDTLPGFYQMFGQHWFPVGNYANFDKTVIKHRVINLDLAYEAVPAQLHLKSYFEMAGVKDYTLRNPRLKYLIDDRNRLFKKYVVIHIDNRETTHRNVHGVNWRRIRTYLEDKGYTVIQIGKGRFDEAGHYFNTVNEVMMMWLISGADFFIGVDSGPSHIAVALGRKCILFFGSVNPAYIHPDLSKIIVLQSLCPVYKQNCWHFQPGTRGIDCEVNIQEPPCTVNDTNSVLNAIDKYLQ